MYFLKQATTVTVVVGPFELKDGMDPGGLVPQVSFSVNGSEMIPRRSKTAMRHINGGLYTVEIGGHELREPGHYVMVVTALGAKQTLRYDLRVLKGNVWESLFGGQDFLMVDVVQFFGQRVQAPGTLPVRSR